MKAPLRALALFLCLLLLVPSLASCGGQDGRPVIAVTIPPEAELVRAVCGEEYRIVILVPPGYSPESYDPPPRTMLDFSRAELFFSVGVPVEEASLLPVLSDNTRHVSLAAAVADVYPDLTIDGGRDPHIWLSPRRAAVMVERIAAVLSEAHPERAARYRENADAYLAELGAADARIREAIEESGITDIIVYHPAFGYLADEYGITMHALESHGSEATAPEMAATVELAREKGIRVIFYQAESDSRQAQSFAAELGGRAVMLSPLAEGYLENLEVMANAIISAYEE